MLYDKLDYSSSLCLSKFEQTADDMMYSRLYPPTPPRRPAPTPPTTTPTGPAKTKPMFAAAIVPAMYPPPAAPKKLPAHTAGFLEKIALV